GPGSPPITYTGRFSLEPAPNSGNTLSRPEQSVMQALESLTETQVSDFLSGRSPLTLALRVGDHMMFVQLQLAAQHAPPAPRSRKPGAVIESFVNHAPGVFSGTFSGTLHPNCQDSSGRPRRDIGTILQILNDLLSATRHYQGMPPSLAQLRCHA
uniref:EGR1-MIDN n=1 Tax=Homo sapiens TaxID=9606 RepID=UPI003F778387